MKIEITHNTDDISAQLIEDVKRVIDKEVAAQIQWISAAFKTNAATLFADLIKLLDIKDGRQRERMQKAVAHNLDKWLKKGLSNGNE